MSNEFVDTLDNITSIICNGGTQSDFDAEIQKLSGFDIRFMYERIIVTPAEEMLEMRLKKIVTEQFLKRLRADIETLTAEQRDLLDSELNNISVIKKRKQRVRNLLKNSNFLEKRNLVTAFMKKVYDVVPEKQFVHNYLVEYGIPTIGFEWEPKGEPLWKKPWYPPESYKPDRKTRRLQKLLEREERAKERWEELVELYGKRTAIAIISKGRKLHSNERLAKVHTDCSKCQFRGSRVCGYCPSGGA